LNTPPVARMSPFASSSRLLIPALPDSTVVTLQSRATEPLEVGGLLIIRTLG
jgi:hypothetical protein